MEYRTPKGGSRDPGPRPDPHSVPRPRHIPMVAWRQPIGGARPAPPANR